jgi:hypothetical protein
MTRPDAESPRADPPTAEPAPPDEGPRSEAARGSTALAANLQRTAVPVVVPREHEVLLEVTRARGACSTRSTTPSSAGRRRSRSSTAAP